MVVVVVNLCLSLTWKQCLIIRTIYFPLLFPRYRIVIHLPHALPGVEIQDNI